MLEKSFLKLVELVFYMKECHLRDQMLEELIDELWDPKTMEIMEHNNWLLFLCMLHMASDLKCCRDEILAHMLTVFSEE